ncbi:MAG: hypothetical protein ISN28_15540 [Ectothiorhodospiraceae bacterium AqS1]|nr:hypothetical protein [Ectothiorhodospiraceae bacterium AqS1]MBF2761645.1 hypothetical protein [Ectothiorhodospiraceae bacterium AqS1]
MKKPNVWQSQVKHRIDDKKSMWFPVMCLSGTSLHPTREVARKAVAELREANPTQTFRIRRLN